MQQEDQSCHSGQLCQYAKIIELIMKHINSFIPCFTLRKFFQPRSFLCRHYSDNYLPDKDATKRSKRRKIIDASNEESSLWSRSVYPTKSNYGQSQAKYSFRPINEDPTNTSIILFPGQGTHYVGMGKNLIKYPNVKRMYDKASEILGYNLYDISVNGPKEKLNRTAYQQPAIFVASLAAVERLKSEDPRIVENCVGTAGFSMGEITALTFAGCFNFGDALTLLKARAEAMQYASEITQGGMMTVFLNHNSKLSLAIETAKKYVTQLKDFNDEEEIYPIIDVRVASYLHPDCKVLAGNSKALEFIELNKESFNIERMKPLSVSGAFHTDLMKPAVEPFTEVLQNTHMNHPQIPVHRNIDGKLYHNRKEILSSLPRQIVKAVKWEQTMHILYERGKDIDFPKTYICGPGTSLKLILGQVNKKASTLCNVIKG